MVEILHLIISFFVSVFTLIFSIEIVENITFIEIFVVIALIFLAIKLIFLRFGRKD